MSACLGPPNHKPTRRWNVVLARKDWVPKVSMTFATALVTRKHRQAADAVIDDEQTSIFCKFF
ncbi:hypothetical protein CKO51_30345 [Rhodopirellula sp. SM50]|nr:hypothetical protein CKO51_30345 [Rhodopirellula sp. SM50]